MKPWDWAVVGALGIIVIVAIGLTTAAFHAGAPDRWSVAAMSCGTIVTALGLTAAYWAARVAATAFLLEATPVLVVDNILEPPGRIQLNACFRMTNEAVAPNVDVVIRPWIPSTLPLQWSGSNLLVVEGEAIARHTTTLAVTNLGRYPTIGLKLAVATSYVLGPGQAIAERSVDYVLTLSGISPSGTIYFMIVNSSGVDVKLSISDGSRAIGPDGFDHEIRAYSFGSIDCPK